MIHLPYGLAQSLRRGCAATQFEIRTRIWNHYGPVQSYHIPRHAFAKITQHDHLLWQHNHNRRGNRIVVLGYLLFVFVPAVPLFAKVWLDYGSYKRTLPPAHLENDRLDDLRDIKLEQTAPLQKGIAKPNSSHYQSLVRKDEIRLLVLHPGQLEDDILFHMEHVALRTNDRRYEALSYAWGEELATRDIRAVEGPHIPVTSNLYSALQHLRHQDRNRTLWVDALCIDQSDMDERIHQVRLMGDVYAKADRVVIWLGEECAHSSRAFSSIESLYANSWQSNLWHITWSKEKHAKILNKKFVPRTVGELVMRRYFDENLGALGTVVWAEDEDTNLNIKNIDWVSIRALLQRSWFHRLWVIQEVSSAKRAIVICGSQAISWNALATSLTYLVDNDLTKYLDTVSGLACTSVASIQQIRRRETKDPLFTVALDNTYGDCRDPRDKIFALMSISEGRDIFDWEISFDYTLLVEELYKRFAIWDIARNETLRVLSCETSGSKNSQATDLPSWVPDWTQILDRHLLVRASSTSTFCASKGKESEVWFTHDKNVMHVEGAIVDSIHTLGSEPHPLKTTSLFEIDYITIQQLHGLKDWLLESWEIAKASRPMTPTTYDAFWRTMLCDLESSGKPAPKKYSEYFLRYSKFVREAPAVFSEIIDNPAPITPYGLTAFETLLTQAVSIDSFSAALAPDSWAFHTWFEEHNRTNTLIEDSLQKWGKSKRFCRTRDGRLARVPRHATTDDMICILHGSEVPHVLRQQDDGTYTVVGECYVHGIMHGEALSLATYQPQILRLR